MKDILDQFDLDEETVRDWRLFAGKRAGYYVQQWRRIKQGQWVSFNVSAFVFGVFWLLYRQMLRPTILYLSIFFAEGFVEKLVFQYLGFSIPPVWWIFTRTFLFALLLGLFGNWIYLIHAEDQIQRIKASYPPERQEQLLRLNGGTSFVPVILFLLLILVILLSNRFWLIGLIS
jgi:hypothetical protein